MAFKRTKPRTAPGERVYAVGDIHGRLDLFQRLLERLEDDSARRRSDTTALVVLGDVIDRGPYSRQLLELLFEVQRTTDRVILLCGNHEELLLHSAAGSGIAQAVWVENGGMATLESYGLDPTTFLERPAKERGSLLTATIGEEVLDWLAQLPLVYRSGDYFFCHAGVRPGVPLDTQQREDLLWIRDEFLRDKRDHNAVIVHGHSEVSRVEFQGNRINVDTAAHRSGVLSAIGVEDSLIWVITSETN